jgi:hypothetical protein
MVPKSTGPGSRRPANKRQLTKIYKLAITVGIFDRVPWMKITSRARLAVTIVNKNAEFNLTNCTTPSSEPQSLEIQWDQGYSHRNVQQSLTGTQSNNNQDYLPDQKRILVRGAALIKSMCAVQGIADAATDILKADGWPEHVTDRLLMLVKPKDAPARTDAKDKLGNLLKLIDEALQNENKF